MNEVPDLKHIKENCDNFAYCLNEKYGARNADYRANDEEPFACATYSFCPDPCCPTAKHMFNPILCEDNVDNPCYETNPPGKRRCELARSENTNFHDMILHRWNVTCNCSEAGFRWSSRYGLCVDVDECSGDNHGCDNNTEICVNLVGSYECACRWGYAWNFDENNCTEHGALAVIRKEIEEQEDKEEESKVAKSLLRRLYEKILSLRSGGEKLNYSGALIGIFLLYFIFGKCFIIVTRLL